LVFNKQKLSFAGKENTASTDTNTSLRLSIKKLEVLVIYILPMLRPHLRFLWTRRLEEKYAEKSTTGKY